MANQPSLLRPLPDGVDVFEQFERLALAVDNRRVQEVQPRVITDPEELPCHAYDSNPQNHVLVVADIGDFN